MEPTNQGEVSKLNQVIQIDEGKSQEHLREVVRSTVEETLNAMLDAEADRLCRTERYECVPVSFSVARNKRPD
jgi:putative transposase